MAAAASTPSLRDSARSTFATTWPDLLVGGIAFGFVAGLAADDGGYFPRSWGVAGLALLWIAAIGLVLRARIRLGSLAIVTAAALSGLLLWTALSAFWSESHAPPLRESGRSLIYVAGLAGSLFIVRANSYRALLTGIWAAIALVCSYSLATRLFPERYADPADLAAYRLDEPFGYRNALGIFAVLGLLLALGMAARGRPLALRTLSASSTVVMLPTLYFTFSRGAWIALAAGLLALVALDSRRLQLIAAVLIVGAWPSLAVWSSSRFEALTHRNPNLAAAAEDGRQLVAVIAVLVLAAGLSVLLLAALEARVRPGRRARLAAASALTVAGVAGLGGTFAAYGSPFAIAERAYDQLNAPLVQQTDLRSRLFTLSSPARVAQWRVAWDQYEEHRWVGAGAGTFERSWLQHRPALGPVRDAHNLYLETLAELGIVGLLLLLAALVAPLVAAVKARGQSLVPAAFAAYVAYLVHAGLDWDWEMPAVTLTALLSGVAVLLAAQGHGKTFTLGLRSRTGLVLATLALGAFAFVGLVSSQALAASDDAREKAQLPRAESEARKAARWAPWSAEPWQALADVEFARKDPRKARAALLEALERDRGDWAIWYDLGVASKGRDRLRAFEEAARLNPFSANVAVLRRLRILPSLTADGSE